MSTCHLYRPYSHLSLPQNASPIEPCPYDLGFLHSSHLRAIHAVPSTQSALPQDCLGSPVRARLKSHLLQEALPDHFSSTKLPICLSPISDHNYATTLLADDLPFASSITLCTALVQGVPLLAVYLFPTQHLALRELLNKYAGKEGKKEGREGGREEKKKEPYRYLQKK